MAAMAMGVNEAGIVLSMITRKAKRDGDQGNMDQGYVLVNVIKQNNQITKHITG
jgi:hypothetical protein